MTATAYALVDDTAMNWLLDDGLEGDLERELARAGLPVIERLAEDVGDLAISIVLTDVHENVIGRVGRALASASTLGGRRDYAAAPIIDSRRGVPAGAVGVTGSISNAGDLMLPYAQLAARIIAERMLDSAAVARRTTLEHFLRARRRARGPLVGVDGSELLTNAAAARVVQPDDHDRIWSWAMNEIEAREPLTRELHLGAGTVTARCAPVCIGRDIVGALIYLDEHAPLAATKRGRRLCPPKLGWESLRASELGIAGLVAEGLTNREVATRLIVSPHTVDFHLRQIYRKLSITSRIELTRLVLEHAGSLPNNPAEDFPK